MIPNVLVGCALAVVLGVPLTALGVAVELLEKGLRCKPAPAWRAWLKPLAALAVRLWERLDTFELPAPAAPVPAPRRHVNGVNRGTQPRLTPYPTAADPVTPLATDDAPPWDITTTQQPALDEPAYGVDRCEADVDEAGRHFALAMGPDGCEET